MKQLHALSLFSLLAGSIAITASFVGCSSSSGGDNGGTPGDETGTDTAVDETPTPTDSTPKTDSAKDTKPPADVGGKCDTPLDSTFACKPPPKTGVPGTVCSEKDLSDFVTACIAAKFGVGSGCNTWRDAHPACNTCIGTWALPTTVIPGKVYPDRDQCYWKVLPDACSTSIQCMFDCDTAVCGTCLTDPGSSPDGKTTEQQDCIKRERLKGGTAVPRGACYDKAAGDAITCLNANSDLTGPCIVGELFSPSGASGAPDVPTMQAQVLQFYRGACRDNGSWKNSSYSCSTPPCAAVDGGTDTATTDTGTTDTATTDTADGG